MRSAPLVEAFCKPFDAFDHPLGARLLVVAETWTLAIPALILLLGLRRIIRRTYEDGPFSTEAVRLLSRSHWWAGALVAIAGLAHAAVEGVTNDLVANASWPDFPSIWPAVAAVIAVRVFTGLCAFGSHERQAAYERGLAAQRPVD